MTEILSESVGGSTSLRMAGQVLKGEIEMDQALLKSQSANILHTFVEGLNVLAGEKYFDLDELTERIRSGESQRALDGAGPLFRMPEELEDWSLGKPTKTVDEIRPSLEALVEESLEDFRRQEEINRQIGLQHSAARKTPTPPKPWLPSAIVFGLGLVLSGLVIVLGQSPLIALGIILISMATAAFVLVSEMKRFNEYVRDVVRDSRKREMAIHSYEKELDEVMKEVKIYRSRAKKLVNEIGRSRTEEIAELKSEFSQFFEG